MSEASPRGIRVTVRAVQILDSLDLDKTGEFIFWSSVSSDGGPPVEGRYPANGHMKISQEPVFNRAVLNWVIFEGEASGHLAVQVKGEEEDRFGGNDCLATYEREFEGSVDDWFGRYGPGRDTGDVDEDDPEMMSNWRVTLLVEPA